MMEQPGRMRPSGSAFFNAFFLHFLKEPALGERQPGGERLSRAAAQRLSLYLRCLAAWPADAGKVSSGRIAAAVGVSDAQVRRDLAALGHLGQRGIGYDARDLAAAIRAALGINRTWRAVLVGVGNLARALLRYKDSGAGFRNRGAVRRGPVEGRTGC